MIFAGPQRSRAVFDVKPLTDTTYVNSTGGLIAIRCCVTVGYIDWVVCGKPQRPAIGHYGCNSCSCNMLRRHWTAAGQLAGGELVEWGDVALAGRSRHCWCMVHRAALRLLGGLVSPLDTIEIYFG